jgi:hypothetical protein
LQDSRLPPRDLMLGDIPQILRDRGRPGQRPLHREEKNKKE